MTCSFVNRKRPRSRQALGHKLICFRLYFRKYADWLESKGDQQAKIKRTHLTFSFFSIEYLAMLCPARPCSIKSAPSCSSYFVIRRPHGNWFITWKCISEMNDNIRKEYYCQGEESDEQGEHEDADHTEQLDEEQFEIARIQKSTPAPGHTFLNLLYITSLSIHYCASLTWSSSWL